MNNQKDSYKNIQKFVVEQINGIKLKEGKVDSCPTCGGQKKFANDKQIKDHKKPIKRHQA